MHSVLLAACALRALPLDVQPQEFIRDASWPSHAVITLARGWMKPQETLVLLENGRPVIAQMEVAARWPDESPKYIHLYASFRYVNGKPAKYEVEKRKAPPNDLPASPLEVRDRPEGIQIETGQLSLFIPRPFAGVAKMTRQGQAVLDGPGGPSLVDERGIDWQAVYDDTAEVIVEQQGPAQVTVKASGWYQSAERRVEPFCRFTTRITVFAGSPLVKFDHATTFAADMRKHAVSELAFKFATPGVRRFASTAGSGKFSGDGGATWLAQLTADRLVTIDGSQGSGSPVVKLSEAKARSGGWFSAESEQARIVLLAKDFWQKFPKEVKLGSDELIYYAWPKHGELARLDPAATRLDRIYKFECFLTGRLLDSRLPNDFFAALEAQTDSTECKAVFARSANLEGVSMHNEFALVVLPPGGNATATARYLASLQQLYAAHPIATLGPAAVAASGVLGPVTSTGGTFSEVHQSVRDGMLGYARSIQRWGDYGWCLYGNAHSDELMNPAAAGVPEGRPSLHRVWINNHYQHASAAWQLWALDGDPRMLEWARACTDNYASIAQVRYDAMRGRYNGRGEHEDCPDVMFHAVGGFWHCKGFVPWGGRDYGMLKDDLDAGLTGHWPDPSALLSAWLFDADRWALDGYELWLDKVKFPTGGTRREINETIVHAINAYEFRPKPEILAAIQGMARGLSSEPIVEQHPGPLCDPTWLSRYHELAPEDRAFNKFLLESADTVGLRIAGTWTLALSATAYEMTKDEAYLRRHAGTLARCVRQVFHDPAADKRWDGYGFGPTRDGKFLSQWHRFSYALQKAGIDALPAPDEPGHYFCGACRFNAPRDVADRGTGILIWSDTAPPELKLEACPLGRGGIQGTSLRVVSPKRKTILDIEQIGISSDKAPRTAVTRASSWEAVSETHTLPPGESGLYTVLLGSNRIGVFQPISSYPECQVLRLAPKNREPTIYAATLSHGYLVPLTSARIRLAFTAAGTSDGSYVAVRAPGGRPIAERYLRRRDPERHPQRARQVGRPVAAGRLFRRQRILSNGGRRALGRAAPVRQPAERRRVHPAEAGALKRRNLPTVSDSIVDDFDAQLTPAQREAIALARNFGRDVVECSAAAWDRERRHPRGALRQACEIGLARIQLPRERGGLGLRFSAMMRVVEELAGFDFGFAFSLVNHHNATVRIARLGGPAAERLVPRMASGELIGCAAYTEPLHGSDLAKLETTARKVDGGWLLEGRKAWITNAAVADVFSTLAQTSPGGGSAGLATFIVEAGREGFRRDEAYELAGCSSAGIGGFRLANYFVDDNAVLEPPGAGFKAALVGINAARAYVAAMCAGMLAAAIGLAVRSARDRQAFSRRVIDFQGVRWSLVDAECDLAALRLLAYRAAGQIDAGRDAEQAAARAKKFAGQRTVPHLAACIQAMGAQGLLAEYPLLRHLAGAKAAAFADGTTEIMNERLGKLLERDYPADERS